MRITEALAIAGGISRDGDDADVRVIRGSLARPRVYAVSFDDIVDGDSHNVALAPGDIIFVSEHWISSVGEVIDRLGPVLTLGTTVALTTLITH